MSDPPKNASLYLRVVGGPAIFQSALVIAKHNRICDHCGGCCDLYSIVNSILSKWTMELSISDGRDTKTAIRIVNVLKLKQLRAVKSLECSASMVNTFETRTINQANEVSSRPGRVYHRPGRMKRMSGERKVPLRCSAVLLVAKMKTSRPKQGTNLGSETIVSLLIRSKSCPRRQFV